MERHGRNLESKAGNQEDKADQKTEIHSFPSGDEKTRQSVKIGCPREAIDKRHAIQQHTRRQRPQNKIFETGFGRAHAVPLESRRHVKRQTHQFNPEIHAHQVIGGNHHHHAQRRNDNQDRKFKPGELFPPIVINGHDDRKGRRPKTERLHENAEGVIAIKPAECGHARLSFNLYKHPRHHEGQDREPGDQACRFVATKRTDHQQRHGRHGEEDFRKCD